MNEYDQIDVQKWQQEWLDAVKVAEPLPTPRHHGATEHGMLTQKLIDSFINGSNNLATIAGTPVGPNIYADMWKAVAQNKNQRIIETLMANPTDEWKGNRLTESESRYWSMRPTVQFGVPDGRGIVVSSKRSGVSVTIEITGQTVHCGITHRSAQNSGLDKSAVLGADILVASQIARRFKNRIENPNRGGQYVNRVAAESKELEVKIADLPAKNAVGVTWRRRGESDTHWFLLPVFMLTYSPEKLMNEIRAKSFSLKGREVDEVAVALLQHGMRVR